MVRTFRFDDWDTFDYKFQVKMPSISKKPDLNPVNNPWDAKH